MISALRSRFWPVLISAIVSLAILSIPIILVSLRGKKYEVANQTYGALKSLFLDKETDTYSLSKFQFYAWTAAAVFGYVVLTVAESLIQGKFVFADIPANLPGIIFISAATTVTAQGVTSTKGAKGAGDIYPSLADFVSTGGIVAAERFQFFVWTIVGIFTFLFLVVFNDPASINGLPAVPSGFLALMGISSAGYLGGKLARKPGPIIDDVTASQGSLFLKVTGRKLSKDAGFRIDDADLSTANIVLTVGDPDDAGSSGEFYKTLNLTIRTTAPSELTAGSHKFKIVNPDGQEAEWFYRLPTKPKVTKTDGTESHGTLKLVIEGEQLSKNATLEIDGSEVKKENQYQISYGVPDDIRPVIELFKRLDVEIKKPAPDWLIC